MVRDLWWRGLPPSIRGQVWKLSAANELNITSGNIVYYVNYVSYAIITNHFLYSLCHSVVGEYSSICVDIHTLSFST